ncbi:MAG: peptidoglycan endopeptidase [Micrococcales bacterium]|nr:peptidoglycan endopeptidase [Micrococcales bacterium]NDE89199.1 peptidoglycan endopeptidase [Micrococcales bacterium]
MSRRKSLAKKPSGRRRADVEINILESFELRSRRSVRESEKRKQTRRALRAEKKAAKLDQKYFAANPPSNPMTAITQIVPAVAKQPIRKRQNFRTGLVQIVTAGVIATVALPAYAYSPAISAQLGLTNSALDSEQSITLTKLTANSFERGSFGMMSAADLERMNIRNEVRAYSGLTAIDYAASPSYDSLNPDDIMKVAAKYLGVPYVLGGEVPTGLDCSGYTRLVFAQFGVLLPHSVWAQSHDPRVVRIPRDQAKPGDLVILNNLSHEGIYAGNGMFWHAPRPGDQVKLAPIFTDSYFIARVVK